MTANTVSAPYEECKITVAYAPIKPDHETMVLSGFDEFGTPGMIVESNFENGSFTVFVDIDEYPDELIIRETVKAAMNEAYGPVGARWSQVEVEWI